MSVREPGDQGVQVVLLGQGVTHELVVRQDTHAADREVLRLALRQELVQVPRLVSTVETTDPEVNHADVEFAAVVGRNPEGAAFGKS